MAKSKTKSGARRERGSLLHRNRTPLLLGAGALLLVVGGAKLFNLNQLNNNLEIQQRTNLHRVGLRGLTIRVDVILKNPTAGQLSVKTPYITMAFNGEPLASSDSISKTDHRIPPYGQVPLDPIFITLRYLDMATTAKSFWDAYSSNGKATITVKALTSINNTFPVEKTTVFELGAAAPTEKGLGSLLAGAESLANQPVAFQPMRREHTRRLSS